MTSPSAPLAPIVYHDVDRSYYVGEMVSPRGMFRLLPARGSWDADIFVAVLYRRGDRAHVALFPWRLGLRALSSLRPADLAPLDTVAISAGMEAWLQAVFLFIARLGGLDPSRLFTAAELGFRDEDGGVLSGDAPGPAAAAAPAVVLPSPLPLE